MPFNEFQRIRTMERFLDLNISRENELQNIVMLAAEACQAAAAFLVFFEEGELSYKYQFGSLADVIPEQHSFWDIKLTPNQVYVVPDTLQNAEFADQPMVKNHPNIRFYAGVPLTTHDGQNIGSLYVLDQKTKVLSERRMRMLELLSNQAVNMVEFELSLSILKEQFNEAKNVEVKLRSFFESSKSSHLLVGPNLEVLTYNKTFYDIVYNRFGIEVSTGANVVPYIHPKHADYFVSNIKTALTGKTIQYEKVIEFDNLDPIWYKITYNPAYDSEGNIIGVSYNATDITERKQNEEKILLQNKALRDIAYMQSHELRKPVASILGLMTLLKLEDVDSKSQILNLMEIAVLELDETIHRIVKSTETQTNPEILPDNQSF